MITGIDHLVLTVASLEATCHFYVDLLGAERRDAADGPTALVFGDQKINVHETLHTFEPIAAHPTPGSGDICLITTSELADVADELAVAGFPVEVGPVPQTGARGPMTSIYLRDPDRNLVEIACYER